jgi:solute carrier family 25 S-adenosylmethionine transporter 26
LTTKLLLAVSPIMVAPREPSFACALIAGGIAGTSVDVALYPLDTLKTRMQSAQGFLKAGGFRGIYNGLSAAAAGSAPGAALFFSTYETMKGILSPHFSEDRQAMVHMTAASCGETVACTVRVPTEVIKQRMQAGTYAGLAEGVSTIWRTEGVVGFYRGYLSTVMREIPFAFIQFPLYEAGKKMVARRSESGECSSLQAASCGSASGAFAAAVTTPLDVVKTRLMLGADASGVAYTGMADTFSRVYRTEGARTLFSGVQPRTFWIGIGGFVFFGAYEKAKVALIDVV